jgi:hypothetical protein
MIIIIQRETKLKLTTTVVGIKSYTTKTRDEQALWKRDGV